MFIPNYELYFYYLCLIAKGIQEVFDKDSNEFRIRCTVYVVKS